MDTIEKIDNYLNEAKKSKLHAKFVEMSESDDPLDFLEEIKNTQGKDFFREFMEFLREKVKKGKSHKNVEKAFNKYLDKHDFEG